MTIGTVVDIVALGPREFRVEVTQGGTRTEHRVTVPDDLGVTLAEGTDPQLVVRESFAFLLEREPATSILRRFSLSDITRYFPEFPAELGRRLA